MGKEEAAALAGIASIVPAFWAASWFWHTYADAASWTFPAMIITGVFGLVGIVVACGTIAYRIAQRLEER